MSDKKVEVEFDADTRGIDAALEGMERRIERVQQKFNHIFERISERMPDASTAERVARARQATKSTGWDDAGYAMWRSRQREGDRRFAADVRAGDQEEKKAQRKEDSDRRREQRDVERVEKDLRKADAQDKRENARMENRVARWSSSAKNRKYLADEEESAGGGFRRFFGGGGGGGGITGMLGGIGGTTGGILGGAARVVGGAALGVLGGGGIIGTLASTILGPLGALGGVVTAVVGAIMRGGQQQVEHTRGLLGEMRTDAITFEGRASVGDLQGRAMDYAKYGYSHEEGSAMSAAARAGGRGARFGIDPEVLARGALNGVDAGLFGRYASLSQRFGVLTGGMRGAERLGAMSKSLGLGGSIIPEIVAGGYEQLAGRGLNVDNVPFESLLGRAMTNDNFQAGGERSVRGLMAIEGMRGDTRDQIGAPFKELAGSLQLMRAYQAAGKSGKTGFGFISEAMAAAESPDMGADSTRDFWRSRGGDFATVMGQAVGGLTQSESRGLMGELSNMEAGPADGRFTRPGGEYAKWDLFAWDKAKDFRSLGDPNDVKELVELTRNMKEISMSMSSAAGWLAKAANSVLGR